MEEDKDKYSVRSSARNSSKITIHDLKSSLRGAGIEEDVLLPPGYQKRSVNHNNHGGIRRAGKPVQDAKYTSEYWHRHDQIIYITKEHAEKILTNPDTPKTLKKLLLFNLDQFNREDKKDFHMDGRSVPINITKLIEHDVFGYVLDNPIIDKEADDAD